MVFISGPLWAWAEEARIASIDKILDFRDQQLTSNLAQEKTTSNNGIESTETVSLNGLNHVINIRGQDLNNPILLVLHGGAGWPLWPLAYKYFRSWEKNFTVVQWDQRGAGKTHCANPDYDPSAATFEDFLSDTVAVVDYLRTRLNKQKIVVLGASWGSALGIHLIKKKPEWIAAYIGTGQVAYVWEQEKEGYAFVLREAYARGDKAGIAALEALKPYPSKGNYMDKVAVQRKYALKYGGGRVHGTDFMSYYHSAFFESPDYTLGDWACFYDAIQDDYYSGLMARQFKQDSDTGNLPALGNVFDVPIFFFLGKQDEYVSMRLGVDYFMDIKAPYKRLVLFDESAHAALMEQPEAFFNAIQTHVLPIVNQSLSAKSGK